ncbi:MAG: hypothetical protein E7331_08325 [Clostridiales bacterium]|nr:hypothetical protein [Clostridiales bacterium]
MKMMHRLMALLTIIIMMAGFSSAYAADDGYASSYTYNYDYWGDIRESPDAYRVENVLYSSGLGLETAMKKPQSLYVRNNDIYVCDTGNNRIIQIRLTGSEYKLVRIIDTIQGADIATFNTPSDVFVDAEENIYIADTNNGRVVMVDKDLNFIKEFVKPTDSTYDQSLSFLPNKIVVDVSGRVFVLATNVNKGLVKFEADTTFTGYVGANKVSYNLAEYIWKMWFSTKEQRAQQESFVPTEYCNIYMDEDSFIYATNIVFSEYDLLYDVAQPIRRLNGIGNDILIKNDRYPPIGELYWQSEDDVHGPSKLVDITVLENDIYVAVDRTRGRIFGYDSQGIMLWAFGTSGNSEGAFNSAISIEHMGKDLIVLDQNEANITIFKPTEYGNLIYAASEDYLKGDYDGSAEKWEEVLKHNANYNLAFIGIGRSLMRQEKYKEAMDYFEMAHDRDNYGRAFRQYRKIWVEENIGWMIAVIAALLIIPLIIRMVKKTRMEVEVYERGQIAK